MGPMKELADCTVMVVDDTEENIDILVETLGEDYEVSVAMDGETALRDISANPPDLILLDIMMPGMNGYEVCRRLKDDPVTRDIPVIFVTAMGEMEDEQMGLELGAIDYIRKPITPILVKTKVKNQLMVRLAHGRELGESTAAREKIEEELKVAREIQMDILPQVFPPFPGRPEIDLHAFIEPARDVGGDFYDFFFNSEDMLCFVIGDVAGKGVPAALFMSAAKTLIKATAQSVSQPDRVLDIANRELAAGNETCTFVTVFLGILNVKTGKLCFANAGHNLPLIVRQEGEAEYLSGGKSTALGLEEDTVFSSRTIQLQPKECICLYTDGVTEAFNQQEEQFSEERLQKEISGSQHKSMKELTDEVIRAVESFAEGTPQSDDITMLCLRYRPGDGRVNRTAIEMANKRSEIPRVVESAAHFWEESGVAEDVVHDARLALDEIITNIVSYAFEDSREHGIVVELEVSLDSLVVRTEDDGRSFDPTQFVNPDMDKPFDEREVGGAGIHLVRNLMDEMEYEVLQGKNILRMKKYLHSP